MKTPLGTPVANEKKSPLTPAVVADGAIRRCMSVSVSLSVRESLERTGVSVVAPEAGRGPVRTLIATGPFGVNCAPVSKVTPGQSARVCAPAGATRQSATSAVRRRRRPIDRFEGSGARGVRLHS